MTAVRHLLSRLQFALALPTARTFTVLIAASLIYLFANQTQVGWMYVMAALLTGMMPAAWAVNRRALTGNPGRAPGQ